MPLMWLIFRTRPGGAGGGPGVPGLDTLMMLPAVTNSPLIPASDCTVNAPVTTTLELLFVEVPEVIVELLFELVLELDELDDDELDDVPVDDEDDDVLLFVGLVLAFTPELEFAVWNSVSSDSGRTRRLIWVLGPTELRFRLAMPEVTSMTPPATRLKLRQVDRPDQGGADAAETGLRHYCCKGRRCRCWPDWPARCRRGRC